MMAMYKLTMRFEKDNGEFDEISKQLLHENFFTKEQYKKICKEALSKCDKHDLFSLESVLIEEYGFKHFGECGSFNFFEN